MSTTKDHDHFNENGIGATHATSSFGDSIRVISTNDNSSPSPSSPQSSRGGKSKLGWFIAGTLAFVLIIGLAVGLNKPSEEKDIAAPATAVTALDDGDAATTTDVDVPSTADIATIPIEPSAPVITNDDGNDELTTSDIIVEGDKQPAADDAASASSAVGLFAGDDSSLFEQSLPAGDFVQLDVTEEEEMTPASSYTSPNPTSSPTKSPMVTNINELVSSEPLFDSVSTVTNNTSSSPSNTFMSDPSASPTRQLSDAPTVNPTKGVTLGPTASPSISPNMAPTKEPTNEPTNEPTTGSPSSSPSNKPTTSEPTSVPTKKPVIQMDMSDWALIFANTRPSMSPTKAPATSAPVVPATPAPVVPATPAPTNNPTPSPTTLSPTQSPTTGKPTPTFSFFGKVGEDFWDDEKEVEASGVDIAPDRSHLVIAADGGDIIFLNLLDYNSGSCILDMTDDVDGDSDFEGVAIDPTIWKPDDMHAYVVHEGGDDDEPKLYKIRYEYDPAAESCSASVVDTKSLRGAIPCLETSNGIESLGLKSPSTDTEPAVFFVGVQDTGKVYEVTSDGVSNGPNCYDSGMGTDDLSASTYSFENGHIWSFIESENTIAVVDTAQDCAVTTIDMSSPLDEEGLTIDFENNLMYLVVDGQGDGSVVSVYNFTYPKDLGECMDNGVSPGSCSNFEVCGGRRSNLRV